MKQEVQEVRGVTRGAREELGQVKQIPDGKSYLPQSVFGSHMFALLTRVWCSSGAFAKFPRSAADAASHYAAREGDTEHKLFWAQF